MIPPLAYAVARGSVIDGDRRFSATLYDDGTISICAFALHPGLDGSQASHWTKPTNEAGKIVAHASRAAWNRGTITPLPALVDEAEDIDEREEHVDLATLMRPEAIEALGQLLARGARGRGGLSITLPPRSTP